MIISTQQIEQGIAKAHADYMNGTINLNEYSKRLIILDIANNAQNIIEG